MVLKRSQCDGFARAYTMLLRRADIPAMTVYGYIENGGNHAWNVVFINGEWRVVDVTGIIGNGGKLDEYYLKKRNDVPNHLVVKNLVYDAIMKAAQ